MNESPPYPGAPAAEVAPGVASPPTSYSGRTRYTLLEYEALLANASIGIAFTRERKFFLCNPKFSEMFGWAAHELIGQLGQVVYANRASYEALGAIAMPILAAGRQLDIEWEVCRRDGSTFLARVIAKAINASSPEQGTIWIVEDITERKRASDELTRLVREQETIFETASVGIAFNKDRRIVRCNRRYEEMYGYAPGELAGQPMALLYPDEEAYRNASAAYAQFARGLTWSEVSLRRRKDGGTFWVRTSGRAMDAGDPHKGSVWINEDITEQKRADEEIRRLLAEQELILDNATVGIAFVRNRIIQRCNRHLEEMVGRAAGTLVGQPSAVLFAERAEYEKVSSRAFQGTAPGDTYEEEVRFLRADGSTFPSKSVGRRIDSGGGEQEWIWSFDDVSAESATRELLERAVAQRTAELQSANVRLEAEIAERKQAEQRARHLADHDALTGLPNRRLLEDRLTQALALSTRNRRQTAVLFIDLDRFKTVNDTLGHAVGDQLLKGVAQRLVDQLREGDTICRVGGDEFVVVLPEIRRGVDSLQVVQKVIDTLSKPFALGASELLITPSIGISVFPGDGQDAETLIRNADAAMYHAKQTGRSNYQFFTEQLNVAASRRLHLENDLRRAVHGRELLLYYQPVFELKTGRAVMHEALLRWRHPSRGLVEPADFIQLAEDTGLILKIGERMLPEACAWAMGAQADRRMPVAVNLSARQFNDSQLLALVSRTLKETGLSPGMLEFELTEATLMQHGEVRLDTLKKLKDLGVSLAIDDFGTGYSSLAFLKRCPIDKLKIDKSFMSGAVGPGEAGPVVMGVIALAHALGLKVVAEGVESQAQKEFLQSANCDLFQGFLSGKPVEGDVAARARNP